MKWTTDLKRLLLPTIALLVLTGCQPATPPSPTPTPEKFTIVPVYRYMLDYVEAARAAADPDLDELTRLHIIEPHYEQCGEKE